MRNTRRALTVLICALIPPPVFATSFGPFSPFVQADPCGRYYVFFERQPGTSPDDVAVKFTLAKRGRSPDLALALREYEAFLQDRGRGYRSVRNQVRDEDLVMGQGSLDRFFVRLVVSSTGLGFVVVNGDMDNSPVPPIGRDALIIVGKTGAIVHRKSILDLFDKSEVARFRSDDQAPFWYLGGWIDESRREFVLASAGQSSASKGGARLLRIVELETGAVRVADPDVVLTALREKNSGGLNLALELAIDLKLVQAHSDFAEIFADEQLPTSTRLRAAVALAMAGDDRGRAFVVGFTERDSFEQPYAISRLATVVGADDAVKRLCNLVPTFHDDAYRAAQRAMSNIPPDVAVPALLRLLRERRTTSHVNFAVRVLGDVFVEHAKPAIPDLVELLDGRPSTADPSLDLEAAARCLGSIGPDAKAALPILRRFAYMGKTRPRLIEHPNVRPYYDANSFVDAYWKIKRD